MKWKTLDSKVVYDNPWITVYEDQVINPNGGQNLYGKVSFKNVAAAIIPLDKDNNTWLVGQQRYTLGLYSWEIPMGGAPRTEPTLQWAKRELREETGLTASRWTEVMRMHVSNSITDEEGIVYLAQDLTEGATEFEDSEKLDIRKLPFSEAIRMVESGEITDAISIAALLRVRFLLD